MDIVHNAIEIIVNPIIWGFTWIDPHVARNILMRVTNTRVDDSHHHVLGTGCDIPGKIGVDVSIDFTAGFTVVVQTPEASVGVSGIGNIPQGLTNVVGFDVFKLTALPQKLDTLHQGLCLKCFV